MNEYQDTLPILIDWICLAVRVVHRPLHPATPNSVPVYHPDPDANYPEYRLQVH